jgi:hypothetical protein
LNSMHDSSCQNHANISLHPKLQHATLTCYNLQNQGLIPSKTISLQHIQTGCVAQHWDLSLWAQSCVTPNWYLALWAELCSPTFGSCVVGTETRHVAKPAALYTLSQHGDSTKGLISTTQSILRPLQPCDRGIQDKINESHVQNS